MKVDTTVAGIIVVAMLSATYTILNTTYRHSTQKIESSFVCKTQFGVKLTTVKNYEECVQTLNRLDNRIKGAE